MPAHEHYNTASACLSIAVFKPADCARAASFDRIIKDNVFVLKDGESPMVSLAASDCIGVELADNKLFAGNGQIASGPAKPALNQSNTALPLAAAPRPTFAILSWAGGHSTRIGDGRVSAAE